MRKYLVLPDLHIPFEDKRAWRLVKKVAKALKPYGLVSLGDFGDLLSVSSHPKCPEEHRWQLEDEVEIVRSRRKELDDLDFDRRVMLLGNHDIRGQNLARKNPSAASLFGTLDPDKLYELSKNGWEVYPYQQHVRIGKVSYVHDVGYSGLDAAKQNGQVFQSSVIAGHAHNLTVRYSGNAFGVNHVSAVLGWLGDARFARYMADAKKRAAWQLAFGVVYYEKTGVGHLHPVPIINGRCVVEGRLFTV